MLNKVGFCHNISFWPYLIHFWAISFKNRLKMCAFWRVSRGQPVVNATSSKLVQIGLVVLFESMQPQTPVWS